jgi:hypothetical protein
MNTIWKTAPITSFIFCLLGGLVLLLNGLDKEDGYLSGLGLFCIGVAFFVGPMLGLALEKRDRK